MTTHLSLVEVVVEGELETSKVSVGPRAVRVIAVTQTQSKVLQLRLNLAPTSNHFW